jgi:hypothetical protein
MFNSHTTPAHRARNIPFVLANAMKTDQQGKITCDTILGQEVC